MFKILYEKKYDSEQFGGKLVIDDYRAICPKCGKVIKSIEVTPLPMEHVLHLTDNMLNLFEKYCTVHSEKSVSDASETVEIVELIGKENTFFTFKCPNCNEIIYGKKNGVPYWASWNRNKKLQQFDIVDGLMSNKKTYPTIEIKRPTEHKIYEAITQDEDAGKITMYVVYHDYNITPNTLITTPYYCKVILNYKKHMAYLILDKNAKTGKLLKLSSVYRTLNNVTKSYNKELCSYLVDQKFSRELISKFAEYYFKIRELPIENQFEDYLIRKEKRNTDDIIDNDVDVRFHYNQRDLISKLIAINRFPNMCLRYDSYRDDYQMMECNDFIYHKSFLNIMPKEICDYQEWVRSVITKYNLPSSKYYWSKYMKNPIYLNNVFYLRKCGFKNHDIIRRLLEDETLIQNTIDSNYYDKEARKTIQPTTIKIVKRMLKAKPESSVAKKMMSPFLNEYGKHEFTDMIKMYNRVKQQDKNLLDSVNWGGSIKEIHDDLSLICTKIQYANQVIKYKKEDFKFEKKIGECEFKLAVDTNELVKIGQELRICVGGYRDQALSRHSIILSVKKNNNYVGCIELDYEYRLIQLKGKCNSWLSGEVGKAAKTWVENSPVKSKDDCFDYLHIGKERYEGYVRDYHHLELNEDGEVIDTRERFERHDLDYAEPFFNFNVGFERDENGNRLIDEVLENGRLINHNQRTNENEDVEEELDWLW